ncbi:MAG: HDIG domain-containing protein [Desulfobacterales bacterium]|nr:HDIG domain-containing protein [Desulfobacterales bacterium]
MKLKLTKGKNSITEFFATSKVVVWSLYILVSLIFTVFIYPELVGQKHSYQLGDVVEHDIKAPKDFFIEDIDATEANKKHAMESVLNVYDFDETILTTILKHVDEAFNLLLSLISEMDKEPEPKNEKKSDSKKDEVLPANIDIPLTTHEKIWQLKDQFEALIGISVSNGAFQLLEKEKFSSEISRLIKELLIKILENGVVANKEMVLRELDKGIIIQDVQTKTERTVYKLKQYYGLDQAKNLVGIIGEPLLTNVNYNIKNLIIDFVQRLIVPNITLNRSETKEKEKEASDEVKPVLYKVKSGEMLLREGERVTETQLRILKDLDALSNRDHFSISSIGTMMLIFLFFLTIHIIHERSLLHLSTSLNKSVLFICFVMIIFFFIAKLYSTFPETFAIDISSSFPKPSIPYTIPLASGAMIVCLFMGLEIAVLFALLLALVTSIVFANNFKLFIYVFFSSLMAAYWMQNCSERRVFIKAGAKLGLFNMVLATTLDIYNANFSYMMFLWDCFFGFLGGMVSGVITAGLAPLIELLFDYTTDIKLLEFANLDKPLLRKLMLEAPGTYNHSVIVGTMAEAAASEIGANPLLAKVCGYYHDIGKIKKPLYFIENQQDGKNKHDKLAPSMSALIIIAHVKDGIEMARTHKLGQAIMDTIQQHHGTSLISYFYEKAKMLKGEDAVASEDFRYPGPRPQTREAGIVMLADVVEAASRTLDNPTPARIQGLVQTLVNKIFSDGQLNECELTLKDLHSIAKSFNTLLNGIHHHRIEYSSEPSSSTNGKSNKNENIDKQQPKQARDLSKNPTKEGDGHLKRLGLS